MPIFFVVSGMRLDVRALFATPDALLLVPLFLVLLIIVRGAPVLLLYPTLARTLLQRVGQRAHVPGLGFHPVSG